VAIDMAATDDALSKTLANVVDAQREFIDVCRDDLW
jgi:hypothetical protein